MWEEGGGRKGTLGSCQQGSVAKLLYATLVLFQIENMVIFFSASIRHHLQAYTRFHKPNNDTVNHAAQVANT